MINIPKPIADWLEQYNALEALLTVIAILVVVKLVWAWAKKALPSVETGIKFLRALGRLPIFMDTTTTFMESTSEELKKHDSLLREVKHEVLPNNGGSMRDEQTTIGLRMEKIEAKLAKDHERFALIEEELKIRESRRIGIPATTNPKLRAIYENQAAPHQQKE